MLHNLKSLGHRNFNHQHAEEGDVGFSGGGTVTLGVSGMVLSSAVMILVGFSWIVPVSYCTPPT